MAQEIGGGSKLRFRPLRSPLRVVLVEPRIPQNTGAIARTCVATGSILHLVGKLGFSIDEHAVRRAGLDYWEKLSLYIHEDFDTFLRAVSPPQVLLLSARGERPYTSMPCMEGCSLVFGKETTGLPADILERYPSSIFAIPTLPSVRSLNLSNAVTLTVYECLRKLGAFDDLYMEP